MRYIYIMCLKNCDKDFNTKKKEILFMISNCYHFYKNNTKFIRNKNICKKYIYSKMKKKSHILVQI